MKTFRTSLNTGSLQFPIQKADGMVTAIDAVCLGIFQDATALGEECLLWVIPDEIAEPHFKYVGPRPVRKGPKRHVVAPTGGAA